MFADPKKVKDITVAVRINDYDHEKLIYLANILSEHPSTLARKLFMRKVDELYDAIQEVEKAKLQRLVQSSSCSVDGLLQLINQPLNQIMHGKFA